MTRTSRKLLLEEPQYLEFVERYHGDPLRFAVEVTGFLPSDDQVLLLNAIREPTARVSVVSGTGTGKTATFARIAAWHLLCHPYGQYDDGKIEIGSNTYIAAPKISQVAEGIWKEFQDVMQAIASGPHKWIVKHIQIQSESIYIKGYKEQWYISQLAMQKGASVGVAGKHRYWQLIIVDEAAGVPDEHFDVIDGTQTQGGNRTLLASQGVRNAGKFYETHHKLKKENGGDWTALRFNSENSRFVTNSWLRERRKESGGRDSVEYRIRVLGLFPEDTSNVLLSRKDIESIFERGKIINEGESYGHLILSDVGMGELRDDTVIVLARVIGYEDMGKHARRVEFYGIPLCSNIKNPIDFVGDMSNIIAKTERPTTLLDYGGAGAPVYKLLEREGHSGLQKVLWGDKPRKKKYKERFFNQRAMAMVLFRDAVRDGRVSFLGKIPNRVREKIIDQGSRLPYFFREDGGMRYCMVSKKEMREQGIPSPDIIDAMSFAFLEQATYTAVSGNMSVKSARNKELDEAKRFLEEQLRLKEKSRV